MEQIDSGRFPPQESLNTRGLALHGLAALALLYVFLVGINCLSGGIKGLGSGVMDQYLGEGLNPMLGLLAGILATTLVQSSSVTTSLIVGLAASGHLSVGSAVPMVMGANIGTTVTNTIASLAHSTQSREFERAFAAATCHDFFNFLAVVTLLPLELLTRLFRSDGRGFLEWISGELAALTVGATGGEISTYKSPLKAAFKAGKGLVESGVQAVFGDGTAGAVALALVGALIIFASLAGIVKVMRALVLSKVERYVNRFLGSGGIIAMAVGVVATVMVQSSSITTSILVPLAGAGLMTVSQIYPITLGANVGTTITAMVASLAVSGDEAAAARQIAFVHLFFNLSGILLIYAPRPWRNLPVKMAERMSAFASTSRRMAVVYVAGVFYGVPALIFFASRWLTGA